MITLRNGSRIRAVPGMPHTVSFAEGYTFEAGRTEMQRLLATGERAEAYFCGTTWWPSGR